jgi:hypothetical protein
MDTLHKGDDDDDDNNGNNNNNSNLIGVVHYTTIRILPKVKYYFS